MEIDNKPYGFYFWGSFDKEPIWDEGFFFQVPQVGALARTFNINEQ
jgi:hypothetical protein